MAYLPSVFRRFFASLQHENIRSHFQSLGSGEVETLKVLQAEMHIHCHCILAFAFLLKIHQSPEIIFSRLSSCQR